MSIVDSMKMADSGLAKCKKEGGFFYYIGDSKGEKAALMAINTSKDGDGGKTKRTGKAIMTEFKKEHGAAQYSYGKIVAGSELVFQVMKGNAKPSAMKKAFKKSSLLQEGLPKSFKLLKSVKFEVFAEDEVATSPVDAAGAPPPSSPSSSGPEVADSGSTINDPEFKKWEQSQKELLTSMGEMSAEEALELYQLEKSFSAKEALLIEPDVELSLAETQRANTEMLLGKLESANEDLAELRSALFKSPTEDDIKKIKEQEKAIQDMQLNIASNTLFGTSLTDRAQLTPEEQALMTAATNAGNDILTEQFLKSEMNDIPKDLATFRAQEQAVLGVVKGNADKWWAAEQQWLVVQKDINAVIDAAHQSNPNITQQEINDAIRAHIQSKAPDLLSKDPAGTEAKIKDMTIVFVKKYCMDANTQKSWQDIQDLVSKQLAAMPKEAIQMLNEADYQKIVQDVVQKHNPVLTDLGSGSIVALGQEMMKSIAKSAAHDGSIQSELFEGAGRSIDYLGQLYQDAAKTQLMLTGAVDTFQQDNPGMIPRMPSIKGIARATEKVNAEKGESYKELRDLSRGTIEVTKLTDLVPSVHKFLDTIGKKYPGAVLRRFKNKFKDPAKSGYADIQIHVEVGGHMCEMQFQCTTMLDFKEMGAYPGRAGHKDSGKTVAWADWSILLNGTDKLMVATNTIPTLELIGEKITIPGDAQKSIDKFKKGAGDKDWFVSSHDTYNVSRWLSENKTNALLSEEEQKSLPKLATVWSNLEKEATTAVKAIVGKEMLGDASGDPGEAYTAQEKAIGKFDLPVPKFL